ncbi:metallophosphoesterase, partial [bacterium]|nr:metallophosphoesterase [bacterium]
SSFDTTQFLVECFSKLAPVPVVIVPGNHDYYSSSSVYNPEFLRERRQAVWSENVIIFRKQEFESIALPNVKGVSVTGTAHVVNRSVTERLLKGYVPKNNENVNILMFHGSRDAYKPSEKKITLPFSDDEVLGLGFDYTAVGHYHSYSEIINEDGNVKGAYSGCPFGRNLRECGEKAIIIGTIYEDTTVEIEKRKIDRRSIYDISVDCTGLSHTEAILNAVGDEIKKITRDKNDIVYARLTGLIFPEIVLNIPEDFLQNEYFYITFDREDLKPDYALEDYLSMSDSADTIQSRFVKELKKQMDNTADEKEKEIIENAMYYGLDALVQKSVNPRHKEE